MKLGRDEARLALHENGVGLPDLQERGFIRLVEREDIDEDDGSGLDGELTVDREDGSSGRSIDMADLRIGIMVTI